MLSFIQSILIIIFKPGRWQLLRWFSRDKAGLNERYVYINLILASKMVLFVHSFRPTDVQLRSGHCSFFESYQSGCLNLALPGVSVYARRKIAVLRNSRKIAVSLVQSGILRAITDIWRHPIFSSFPSFLCFLLPHPLPFARVSLPIPPPPRLRLVSLLFFYSALSQLFFLLFLPYVEKSSDNRCILAICSRTCF